MTPFTDVYPYALQTITDYRLDILAQQDYDTFLLKLQEILVAAVPRFTGCMQSLDYDTSSTTPYFVNDLTLQEKSILGTYMVLVWWEKLTNDITQVNLLLQSRNQKTHSESSDLKEKVKRLNVLNERVTNSESEYQKLTNNFNQIFGLE